MTHFYAIPSRLLRPAALLAAIAAAIGTAGCSQILAPEETRSERRPAVLAFYTDPVRVLVPDTVAVGAPVTLEITSYGGGCIGQGETDVTVAGLVAEVRPYDYFVTDLPPATACTEELRLYTHVATVQFARAGRALVRVHGWEQPSDRPLALEREVVVR